MKKFFPVLILFVSVTFMFGQTNYYVSTSAGDDVSGDGSSGNPWATIQHAVSSVSDPTTATIIINVAAGDYTESVSINRAFTDLTLNGDGAQTTTIQANASYNTATTRTINISTSNTLTITDFTIQNGKIDSDGAGINNNGVATITNCVIQKNIISSSSVTSGAGIYNTGTLTISNSTINDNTSYNTGGGLGTRGPTAISNCTFYNNTATSNDAVTSSGGGIYIALSSGDVSITNCTIVENSTNGSWGGGVQLAQGTLNIKNTIIANSTATSDYYDYDYSSGETTNDGGYNIVENAFNDIFTGVNNNITGNQTDLFGTGVATAPALALNNSTNGTPTNKLVTGSVAIDAGTNTGAPTTDQRGASRNGTTDIGAYEYYDDSASTPVELTSFTVTSTDAGVVLNWTTATEVNNYGFDVESKINTDWEVIGFVDGHGNSNSPKNYSFVVSASSANNVSFRLKQIDIDGAFKYSDVVTVSMKLSKEFSIAQNYPNPFNPTTSITFTLPSNGFVTLKVYNAIGEVVAELLNKNIDAGNHSVVFDAANLPTGAYFYRITADNFSETKKMLLLK